MFAIQARKKQEEEIAEQKRIKSLVLSYEYRDDEDEVNQNGRAGRANGSNNPGKYQDRRNGFGSSSSGRQRKYQTPSFAEGLS